MMMGKEVIRHFSKCRLPYRIAAVLLITVMLLLCGCNEAVTSSSESSSSSSETSNTSSNNSSSSVSSEDTSSDETSADKLSGVFSYEETTSNIKSDAEAMPVGNTANLSKKLKGYADDEAEALREEILNTGNTEDYYKIKGTKYYVSSLNGDDLNSGKSPEEALKSLEGISSLELKSGDAVLFERGSVFRLYTSLLTQEGVTYGSYGDGNKPRFYGSPINFVTITWTPSVKKNVWQIDYIYPDCCSMIFDYGEAVGYKKTSLRYLDENTEFFYDESTDVLYLYCDKGNPSKVYESIEVAAQRVIINIPSGVNNVTVDNLCIKYGGVMGVSATWDGSGITVTNCEMGYIGGGTTSNGNSRYGNAIQFWTGAVDIVCDHNWIYQTWDTAISWQGYGGSKFKYENISFSYNLLEYNNGDFEFWDDGSTIKDFVMQGNIMRFTSQGWGTRADDGGFRGIDGCFVGNIADMTVENLYIKNNIIDCPGRMIINLDVDPDDLNKEVFVSGSEIYVNSSSKYRSDTEILRGFKNNDSDPNSLDATNEAEFLTALKRFDPKGLLKWY